MLFDATWGSENEVAQLAKDLEARRLPSLMLNGMPLSAASPLRDGRAEVLWPFSEAVLQEMVRELVLRTQQGLPYQH
ncbi:hypothetical protein [Roseomonas sp. 18066]|uniref:hypothetical protein n=1 Tax=Roseomonas sp. 18066 TaxID=2681412 RepID=UPI0013573372|nr:hypothetical protein [Roseomonas sp. 18066]